MESGTVFSGQHAVLGKPKSSHAARNGLDQDLPLAACTGRCWMPGFLGGTCVVRSVTANWIFGEIDRLTDTKTAFCHGTETLRAVWMTNLKVASGLSSSGFAGLALWWMSCIDRARGFWTHDHSTPFPTGQDVYLRSPGSFASSEMKTAW